METRDDFNVMMDPAKELSGRKKPSVTIVAAHETLKEKMARTRDERAERLSNISLHHRHICEMVSIFLDVSVDDVVDSVIDTKLSMAAMDSFLEKDTRDMSVLFYLQHESPRLSSQSRFDNQFDPHHRKVQLSGHPNVGEEVNYTLLDGIHYSSNIVAMTHGIMKGLISSPLSLSKEWGDLSKTETGKKKLITFDRHYSKFENFVNRTRIDVDNENSEDANRLNKDLIQKVEFAVRIWNKKIERALVQYQQLRKEDEFVGPLEEVEYWRNQLARFSSMFEFVSSASCKKLINFLKLTASPTLKTWKKHCNLVLDVRNECIDNVRYLYSFDSFCEPLYRCTPRKFPVTCPLYFTQSE
ncbi:hypothetical protein HHI36_024220 [Cryptolaemus montrouzieri]|uniref:Dynein heavy chain tail domain-containing protein n=1 Tax=Cryptolaemus montrouzieri TaxID=559131 RepID=A0ABD2NJ02_9CUCU